MKNKIKQAVSVMLFAVFLTWLFTGCSGGQTSPSVTIISSITPTPIVTIQPTATVIPTPIVTPTPEVTPTPTIRPGSITKISIELIPDYKNDNNNIIRTTEFRYFRAVLEPSTATNFQLNWTSSDPNSIAIITGNNAICTVKAMNTGYATITVAAENGIMASYDMIALQPTPDPIPQHTIGKIEPFPFR